ncbi:MAG: hypothetical protein ACREK6_17775 [Candidatus Rokuibacteriota bacterium]
MRALGLLMSGLGIVAWAGSAAGQARTVPDVGPPFEQAQAVWKGFWQAVSAGDLNDAKRYVHSQRQPMFPATHGREELQRMASEMAHCRLDPSPVPIAADEVIYRVLCEHRGERAEGQIGLRRDRDGAWRLSVL